MTGIFIPENIKFILNKLREAGFEAYVVGGCVRDSLLGREPKDWDITTAATPEEIKEVFKDYPIINNNGEKHGTVTVRYEEENIEITTFRIDGDYKDSRHPESVEFTRDLKEDLARRDFTINAMAAYGDGIIDPFGGRKDLEAGIIRAVGNPADRFEEDALRILRGIRFACKYSFDIENRTCMAMFFKKDKLQNISKERILSEIKEIFSYSKIGEFMQGMMISAIIFDIIPEFKVLNKNLFKLIDNESFVVNIAGLLTFIKTDELYHVHDIIEAVLNRLGFSNSEKKEMLLLSVLSHIKYNFLQPDQICDLAHIFIDTHHYTKEEAFGVIKNMIKIHNNFFITQLAYDEKYYYQAVSTLSETFRDKCVCIKDLAINGTDLVNLGFSGANVGKELRDLFDAVSEGEVENTKEALLDWASCDC